MMEHNDHAVGLDLAPGLNGVKYEQKFVKAKPETPYPCNYSAEKVPANSEAMRMTMGK